MRKVVLFALWALSLTCIDAQNVREELKHDLLKAGSNYYAYQGPTRALSPSPAGYKPFYISTYARHGSRYLIKASEYDYPYNVLQKANEAGKLSELGHRALKQLGYLREDAKDRYGDLTPLGAVQHQQIAQRMYDRFPEVFKGRSVIEARSTVVIRCILSMQNELLQLAKNNPKLIFNADASQHDMYYMNLQDSALYKQRYSEQTQQAYKDFCAKYEVHKPAMAKLFNDTAYYNREVDAFELNKAIFKIASSVQGTEMRDVFNLFDVYTEDELYNNWLQANAFWYLSFGHNPHNGGNQPFTQRNLLKRIIEDADNSILRPHPGATLRFGHETIILPLACLLDLNGYGREIHDMETLDTKGWINFEVFPMAANIQFVFYRRDKNDTDVLLKVLLNENEATLPIPTDMAPYYHYRDFREFYIKKLEKYAIERAAQGID
jgi:hypothetical protein